MIGLMYAWATKEYLLWECTIGQIFLYLNKGISIQNHENQEAPGLVNKSPDELRKIRDEYRKKYGDIGNG